MKLGLTDMRKFQKF